MLRAYMRPSELYSNPQYNDLTEMGKVRTALTELESLQRPVDRGKGPLVTVVRTVDLRGYGDVNIYQTASS